jgi:uncharacterized protein
MIMETIDKRIIRLLKRHHIFTLATSCHDKPWCATCFFVYDEKNNQLLFTTEKDTRHGIEGMANSSVAGAIALETRVIGKIQGIQFSGDLVELTDEDYKASMKLYLKRFPYAAPFINSTPLWKIEPTYLKMTDNLLGFGKKIIWEKHINI